ncbi:hypothetical protein K435DRAFT_802697 [Dendrothele bispora CBS 962.96]|uniref:Uncharacterized protein n=1 Tax=Dendrothele bispora (strain CBS 962.96) TaxID=1314807 RepID=A0A4S8LKD2_DENBC|nr:hypothetical protein K435DRAFT_802697 [Dendrothele bispora CBS 962.96]
MSCKYEGKIVCKIGLACLNRVAMGHNTDFKHLRTWNKREREQVIFEGERGAHLQEEIWPFFKLESIEIHAKWKSKIQHKLSRSGRLRISDIECISELLSTFPLVRRDIVDPVVVSWLPGLVLNAGNEDLELSAATGGTENRCSMKDHVVKSLIRRDQHCNRETPIVHIEDANPGLSPNWRRSFGGLRSQLNAVAPPPVVGIGGELDSVAQGAFDERGRVVFFVKE